MQPWNRARVQDVSSTAWAVVPWMPEPRRARGRELPVSTRGSVSPVPSTQISLPWVWVSAEGPAAAPPHCRGDEELMKGWEMHVGCVGLAPSSLFSSAAGRDLHPQPRATSACCRAQLCIYRPAHISSLQLLESSPELLACCCKLQSEGQKDRERKVGSSLSFNSMASLGQGGSRAGL